jgi:D-lactate dehydrogenase (cytochrome)
LDSAEKSGFPGPGGGHNLILPMSDQYADFLRDESRLSGCAESISFPHDEQEIQEILRWQKTEGRQVTVQGSRTGLTGASVPDSGHIMNLSRMNRIRGLRLNGQGRFCLRAEPGLTLLELRQQIKARNLEPSFLDNASIEALAAFRAAPEQFFPTDPTEPSASLGGMAACNASGARSFHFGAIRRHIAGLRVVLADGQTLALRRGATFARGRQLDLTTEQGGKIELCLPTYHMPAGKSAAGYYVEDDMEAIDLFIGAEGTLGIISEVELQLLPLPPAIQGATFFFAGEEAAIGFVIAVRESMRSEILALEYFDEHILAIMRQRDADSQAGSGLIPPGPDCKFAVYVEIQSDGDDQAMDLLCRLGEFMNESGGRAEDTWLAKTAADQDKLTHFRHAAPEIVNQIIDRRRQSWPSITKLGTDMSVPDSCLHAVLGMYRQTLLENGLEYAIWGHIGDNHCHVNILPRDDREYRIGKEIYREWAGQVVAMGGSVSAEHGIGKLKIDFLQLMYGKRHIEEMIRLKLQLDPSGMLGAGNMFNAGTM